MRHISYSKTGSFITVGGKVYKWPDGWREALISDLGVASDPFLLSVMQAWQVSTPLQPYTNNPFGMPYVKGVSPQLLNSGYGLFPDMMAFRNAFVAFVNSGPGRPLKDALLGGESLGPLYRAIRALNWPGNLTESDYPSAILDLMTDPVRQKLETVAPADRKTAGIIGYSSAQEGGMGQLGNALQRAANAALSAANALNNVRKG